MRYSLIEEYNIQNGVSATVSLWTQGCPIRCKGCHNQHTWNFDGGKPWNDEALEELLQKLKTPFLKDLAILGGEPLAKENVDDVVEICKTVKDIYGKKVKIFLWTGYKVEKLIGHDIWKYIDLAVTGPFILSRKIDHPFYGSSNQQIYYTSEKMYNLVKEGKLISRSGLI